MLRQGIEEGFYPRYLYKYWPFDSVKRYLETGKVRYAQYTDFNDPFEGGYSLIGNATKEELISFWSQNGGLPSEIIPNIPELITYEEQKNLINDCIKNTLPSIGIFCLTTKCDSLLMWAHYASQHEGVCLKFDLMNDLLAFSSLHKVVYSTEFLNFNFATSPSRVNDILVHKSVDWMYEEEYRVLKMGKAGHILPVNPSALSEIIYGCRMSAENKQSLQNIVSKNPSYNVTIKQACMHPQDFKMIICDKDDPRIKFH